MSNLLEEPSTTAISPAQNPSTATRLSWRQGHALWGLTPLALALLAWQIFGASGSFTFPPPATWWDAARAMNDSDELLPALGHTMLTFLLGTVASVVIGVAAGWMIGSSPTLGRAVNPILELFRSMPAPALVPIATVLFGVTLGMSVVVMVMAVVWPVLLSTTAARRTIPPVRLETGQMLGLAPLARLRKIIFPSLLPDIMIGVRVSASLGFVVSLLVDIIGSGSGIGRLLVLRQQSFDAPGVWAILVIIGLFGLLANSLVSVLDGRVRRGWS